jgi:hypothetical protein
MLTGKWFCSLNKTFNKSQHQKYQEDPGWTEKQPGFSVRKTGISKIKARANMFF